MFSKKYTLLVSLLFTCFMQMNCSDDAKDETPKVIYDFKVNKVECATDVYPGHPLDVNVTISSNDVAENVPVDFSLAEHLADVEANNGKEVKSYPAGTYIIPTVQSGENSYTVRITVPPHAIATGQYELVAVIDPAYVMSKEKEECVSSGDTVKDQEKACVTADMRATVTVNNTYMTTPDLLIEEIVLTSDVVIYEAGDLNPDFITGTVTVKSVAKDSLNVPVRFIIEDGVHAPHPVMIWDSEIGGYVKDYVVGEMRANVSKSFSFALAIDATVAGMLASGANTVNLKTWIDPDNLFTEASIPGLSGGETNNTLPKQLTVVNNTLKNILFMDDANCQLSTDISGSRDSTGTRSITRAAGSGLGFLKSYSQMLGSKMIGANPNFSASATLDENGAAGYTGGSVDIYIFNASFPIVKMEASAAAIPHMLSSSHIDLYLGYIGTVLYSFHHDGEYSWDKKWEVYKSYGYTARFFVGPIPLNVSAGAQGTLGFAVSFSVGDNLEATAGPYVFAGGYASASVGIAGLIEGGVTGNLNLVNVEFKGIATAGMELSAGAAQIRGWLQEQVTLDIAGPNGNIILFAQHPWIRWCKWWWVWYPCGVDQRRYETTLVSFSSWSKTYTLLDLNQTMDWINTGL